MHDWKIRIAGYGTFDFHGTEEEAEATRAHKAKWEQGAGHKYRADLPTEYDRLTKQMCDLFDAGQGVPMTLLRKRQRARNTMQVAA
ncbi:hypothetical protein [Azospirillum sp.]|uniref:hypothetical protein n=1 Tax=Azospirillum sp. TaxID=34012 RepID=UPI003D713ACF